MSLEHETINDSIVIRLHGEFDAAASDAIRSDLETLVNTTTGNIIFDLSDVSFIDSTGMGLIIYAFKRRQSTGGEFRVSGAQGQPLELFKLLRVDRVIKLFATTEEASAQA